MQLKKIGTVGPTHYFLRPDGIIYTENTSPSPLTIEVMIQNSEFIKQLALERGAAVRMLSHFDVAQNIDKKARAYIKSPDSNAYDQYISGFALLCQSGVSRMIGNFMLGLNKGKGEQEVKLFRKEETAVQWLLQLPNKPLNSQGDITDQLE